MKNYFSSFLLAIFFILPFSASTQELSFQIYIDREQIQTSEKMVFEDMKKNFKNFLNKTQWTDDNYKPHEKIQCNLSITLTEANVSQGFYKGRAQLQAVRPVYDSDYESLTLSYVDKNFEFNYNQGQQMNFNKNSFQDNLTSMLSFYVYVILGLDYDSFSELGGTDHIEAAQQIANIAQNASNRKGWGQFEDNPNNRYWLIQNLNNPQFKSFRKGMYLYHRKGLDLLVKEPQKARSNILESLKKIKKAYEVKPNSPLLRSFFNAKSTELINIFSKGKSTLKNDAFGLLKKMDPSNSDSYKAIIE